MEDNFFELNKEKFLDWKNFLRVKKKKFKKIYLEIF